MDRATHLSPADRARQPLPPMTYAVSLVTVMLNNAAVRRAESWPSPSTPSPAACSSPAGVTGRRDTRRHPRHVASVPSPSSPGESVGGRRPWSSSRSCSATCSTAPWRGCRAGPVRGGRSSTPRSTGSPTARCSAGWCSASRNAGDTVHRGRPRSPASWAARWCPTPRRAPRASASSAMSGSPSAPSGSSSPSSPRSCTDVGVPYVLPVSPLGPRRCSPGSRSGSASWHVRQSAPHGCGTGGRPRGKRASTTSATRSPTWAYGAGLVGTVKRMPERLAYSTFERIADTLWSRHGAVDVQRLESNLRHVVGPDDLRRQSCGCSRATGMRSYFRYWCDDLPPPRAGATSASSTPSGSSTTTCSLTRSRPATRVSSSPCRTWATGTTQGAWATLVHSPGRHRRRAPQARGPLREVRRLPHAGSGMDVIPLTGGDPPFPYLAQKLRERLASSALLGDRDHQQLRCACAVLRREGEVPRRPRSARGRHRVPCSSPPVAVVGGRTQLGEVPHARIDGADQEGERSRRIFRTTQLVADAASRRASPRGPTDWHMLQRLWVADLDPSEGAEARDAARRARPAIVP